MSEVHSFQMTKQSVPAHLNPSLPINTCIKIQLATDICVNIDNLSDFQVTSINPAPFLDTVVGVGSGGVAGRPAFAAISQAVVAQVCSNCLSQTASSDHCQHCLSADDIPLDMQSAEHRCQRRIGNCMY